MNVIYKNQGLLSNRHKIKEVLRNLTHQYNRFLILFKTKKEDFESLPMLISQEDFIRFYGWANLEDWIER